MQDGKLYIFLHGLIALVERPTELIAAVIDMGDAHAYKAGQWLTELPFERGTEAELKGVRSGSAGLAATETVYANAQLRVLSPKLYATFRFPKPATPVLALRRTPVAAGTITGSVVAKSGPSEDTIAGLRILVYEFDDRSHVQMDGLPSWTPQFFSEQKRVCTLHIIGEPEGDVEAQHNRKEFETGASLFNDPVTMSGNLNIGGLEGPDEYPAELGRAEALTLIERRGLFNSVAAFYRSTGALLPGESFGGPGGALCGNRAGSAGN